jgi:hypothetical protein
MSVGILSEPRTLVVNERFLEGGILRGAGTIAGNLRNEAEVVVGGSGAVGTLTVQGSYTQSGPGALTLELGGTAAGASDQLVVTGAANLGGVLRLLRTGGFTVATYASVTGGFAGVESDGPSYTLTPGAKSLAAVAQ